MFTKDVSFIPMSSFDDTCVTIELWRKNDPEPFEKHPGFGPSKNVAKLAAYANFLNDTVLKVPENIMKRQSEAILSRPVSQPINDATKGKLHFS